MPPAKRPGVTKSRTVAETIPAACHGRADLGKERKRGRPQWGACPCRRGHRLECHRGVQARRVGFGENAVRWPPDPPWGGEPVWPARVRSPTGQHRALTSQRRGPRPSPSGRGEAPDSPGLGPPGRPRRGTARVYLMASRMARVSLTLLFATPTGRARYQNLVAGARVQTWAPGPAGPTPAIAGAGHRHPCPGRTARPSSPRVRRVPFRLTMMTACHGPPRRGRPTPGRTSSGVRKAEGISPVCK